MKKPLVSELESFVHLIEYTKKCVSVASDIVLIGRKSKLTSNRQIQPTYESYFSFVFHTGDINIVFIP